MPRQPANLVKVIKSFDCDITKDDKHVIRIDLLANGKISYAMFTTIHTIHSTEKRMYFYTSSIADFEEEFDTTLNLN
jgi:hypothetical protein